MGRKGKKVTPWSGRSGSRGWEPGLETQSLECRLEISENRHAPGLLVLESALRVENGVDATVPIPDDPIGWTLKLLQIEIGGGSSRKEASGEHGVFRTYSLATV
jgi:hypothetical protein